MPLTSSVVTQRYQISGSFVARKKFRCSEIMSKFPLGQLQFYIFAEIVFGVKEQKIILLLVSTTKLDTCLFRESRFAVAKLKVTDR